MVYEKVRHVGKVIGSTYFHEQWLYYQSAVERLTVV